MQPELKGRPVVLSAPVRHRASAERGDWQVVHCTRAAAQRGVRPGMPQAEAQALLERNPLACFAPHDPAADLQLLEQMAGWCARYSPLVGLESAPEPNTLFLDVTGCTHLFGGEQAMAARVQQDFEGTGYRVRLALADTPGAAWAAAHFSQALPSHSSPSAPHVPLVIPPGEQATTLAPLPVAALRLPPPVLETLYELGIQQIAQLRALPRSSLPARLGPDVLERLDQALGLIEELIVPVPAAQPIEARWSFEDPTADREVLGSILQTLVADIAATLAARQSGAQRLACRLFCQGSPPVCLTIGTVRPTAVAGHLWELIALQLERVQLAGEVLAIELEVQASGPLEIEQPELFPSGVNREQDRQLAVLLERLSSRLGEESVLRPHLAPHPEPEHAARLVPALGTDAARPARPRARPGSRPAPATEATPAAVADYSLLSAPGVRPLCLKPQPLAVSVVSVIPDGPPLRFRLQDEDYTIHQYWGPERIHTAWWQAAAVERDYYRVETTTGQRFWLFRDNDRGRWYLHGEFL